MGAMAALPAVTTDMSLPSLPVVATELDTTAALVQGTITGVLIGGGVGQLLIGPLSDRYGRRRPVMIGVLIHVITSVLCIFAAGIVPLLVLRVIQGVGNAAAMTTAMAVIRDRYTGATASAIISRLMLVIGVAPLLAPTAGSFIADRSEEHTSELQSRGQLVCRLLLEKKKINYNGFKEILQTEDTNENDNAHLDNNTEQLHHPHTDITPESNATMDTTTNRPHGHTITH